MHDGHPAPRPDPNVPDDIRETIPQSEVHSAVNIPQPLEYQRNEQLKHLREPDPGFLMSAASLFVLIIAVGIATTATLNVFSTGSPLEILEWIGFILLSIAMIVLELFAIAHYSQVCSFILGGLLLLPSALIASGTAGKSRDIYAMLVASIPLTFLSAVHLIWGYKLYVWKRSLR